MRVKQISSAIKKEFVQQATQGKYNIGCIFLGANKPREEELARIAVATFMPDESNRGYFMVEFQDMTRILLRRTDIIWLGWEGDRMDSVIEHLSALAQQLEDKSLLVEFTPATLEFQWGTQTGDSL